jgi:hypothetical protein
MRHNSPQTQKHHFALPEPSSSSKDADTATPVNMDDFLARYRMTNFGPRNGLNRHYFYERKQQLGKPAPYLFA